LFTVWNHQITTIYEIIIWCFVNDLIVACVDGTYGHNCKQNCSDNCHNNMCNVVSGLCVSGCRKGWMGPYCQQRKFMEGTHQTYAVYGRDSSNLYCLWKGLIKLILFMEGTHKTYIVYGRDSSNLYCYISLIGPFHKQHKFDESLP
jgi:hypothetical protein